MKPNTQCRTKKPKSQVGFTEEEIKNCSYRNCHDFSDEEQETEAEAVAEACRIAEQGKIRFPGNSYILAVVGSTVIGAVNIADYTDYWVIYAAVRSDCRRKGVLTRLLAVLIEHAREHLAMLGLKRLALHAQCISDSATRRCIAAGFTAVERSTYYSVCEYVIKEE